MKIAILSFYSGHNLRGVERWTRELAERLSKNHALTVYQNWPQRKESSYKSVAIGIDFDFGHKWSSPGFLSRFFLDYKSREKAIFALKVLPWLWRGRFDVVIPTDGGWEPAFVRILSWLSLTKMVIVGHSGMGWDDRNNLWCFPDTFVALSSQAKEWAKRANPFVKVEYIPDGVDINQFKPLAKKREFNLKKPVVLCVGALVSSKRIGLTIKAVARLKGVSLLVAGDGRDRKKLLAMGEKLLGKGFKLKQFDFEEMPEVYRAADVFSIASMPYYSFEMVLLEAMATNLPVVVNDDPVRREIVGEAGILVEPEDTDAYAEALEKALKSDWGNKPRKQAEKFSWDKVIKKYEKLFTSLVK
jgi:glycosyltransferase involved in cell wall biosynthesis